MKKILIFAVSLLGCGSAMAQTTCNQVGGYTYCNGPNGANSTSTDVGGYRYTNGQDGNGNTFHQTCYNVGATRYCN